MVCMAVDTCMSVVKGQHKNMSPGSLTALNSPQCCTTPTFPVLTHTGHQPKGASSGFCDAIVDSCPIEVASENRLEGGSVNLTVFLPGSTISGIWVGISIAPGAVWRIEFLSGMTAA